MKYAEVPRYRPSVWVDASGRSPFLLAFSKGVVRVPGRGRRDLIHRVLAWVQRGLLKRNRWSRARIFFVRGRGQATLSVSIFPFRNDHGPLEILLQHKIYGAFVSITASPNPSANGQPESNRSSFLSLFLFFIAAPLFASTSAHASPPVVIPPRVWLTVTLTRTFKKSERGSVPRGRPPSLGRESSSAKEPTGLREPRVRSVRFTIPEFTALRAKALAADAQQRGNGASGGNKKKPDAQQKKGQEHRSVEGPASSGRESSTTAGLAQGEVVGAGGIGGSREREHGSTTERDNSVRVVRGMGASASTSVAACSIVGDRGASDVGSAPRIGVLENKQESLTNQLAFLSDNSSDMTAFSLGFGGNEGSGVKVGGSTIASTVSAVKAASAASIAASGLTVATTLPTVNQDVSDNVNHPAPSPSSYFSPRDAKPEADSVAASKVAERKGPEMTIIPVIPAASQPQISPTSSQASSITMIMRTPSRRRRRGTGMLKTCAGWGGHIFALVMI